MIVCEKLRAICQQMPEYRNVVSTQTASARARDFFDIWFVLEHIGADIASPEFACLLSQVFDQKKVYTNLLRKYNTLISKFKKIKTDNNCKIAILYARQAELFPEQMEAF